MTLDNFRQPGKASFVIGGQYGSEGKGAACAYVAATLAARGEHFDIVTVNNGVQSGHTSIHNGVKRVAFHLPTTPLVAPHDDTIVHLNSGAVIDVDVLLRELDDHPMRSRLIIHPNAAIITDDCRVEENGPYSSTTRIASTRKGVGAALARKVMRKGRVARDEPRLKPWVGPLDLNWCLNHGASVAVEVPQGVSLSLDSRFYPFTTSRNCTVGQAMADAGIHPRFYGQSMLVVRTYPIRVGAIEDADGNVLGTSGDCYPDQVETTWEAIGRPAEITTVTKRVRRVFTWSKMQLRESMELTVPDVVMITFCDYSDAAADEIARGVMDIAERMGISRPDLLFSFGPATSGVRTEL